MCFSKIENIEQRLHMNPAVAENGESCGNRSTRSTEMAEESKRRKRSSKQGHCLDGLRNFAKKRKAVVVAAASITVNVILVIAIIVLSGRSYEILPTTLPSPSTPSECCLDGWIGYQRKCYYFSDSDRNWTYSQNYCASFNASLVVIDSQEEMSFLRRHKGPVDQWIGLQRMNDQEPWKWIDGTIFNNWFEIRGGGTCAYLNHQGVTSASRASEERWICSKPVGK